MFHKKIPVKEKQLRSPLEICLMNLPQTFYRVVLVVLKYALRYLLLVCTFFAEFRRIYAVSTRTFKGGLTIDQLSLDLGNLSKLPRHMSFVINEDVDTDYFDLVNLVVWTIAMGIPYITIYEQQGLVKAGELRFRDAINEKISHFLGIKKAKQINVVVKDSKIKYENGITEPKQFCVQLLSESDGREDVANAARAIIDDFKKKRKKSEYEDDRVTVDEISSYLKGMNGVPDPDLIVYFGQTLSLQGYPPWQSRLSEIVHLRSHKHITYKEFYKVLKRYSRCEQRVGK